MWFYTRMVDKALVDPHNIRPNPAFQKLNYGYVNTAEPIPAVYTTDAAVIEFTSLLRINGDNSPMNFPDVRNIIDILKNFIESLWKTIGAKYYLIADSDGF